MGETNTKVKISQNGQYFPGTMERVISVTGSMVNIKRSLDRVLRKAHEVLYITLQYIFYSP